MDPMTWFDSFFTGPGREIYEREVGGAIAYLQFMVWFLPDLIYASEYILNH